MKGDVMIKAENISKRYFIGNKSNSIRELSSDLFRKKKLNTKKRPLWVLKDISFELKRGEILGLIGKNGMGKSTLLKVLARVTPPTSGQVTIIGQVNALLELGTGFHPDLTGRENIFLNGGVLGMSNKEIRESIDSIVAFAEIEQFLDTRVKNYSSGMYLRLAFAIAIHLRFDILILDEVLAVGDIKFRQKCMQAIKEKIHEGKSAIVCSHNRVQLTKLCNKGLVLHQGSFHYEGSIEDSLNAYTKLLGIPEKSIEFPAEIKFNISKESVTLEEVQLFCNHHPSGKMYSGCHFSFNLKFWVQQAYENLIFCFTIKNPIGEEVLKITNQELGIQLNFDSQKKYTLNIEIPKLLFYGRGAFTVDLSFNTQDKLLLFVKNAFQFRLDIADIYNTGITPPTIPNPFYHPDLIMTYFE